jgi:Flp pilus assembly protein TadD
VAQVSRVTGPACRWLSTLPGQGCLACLLLLCLQACTSVSLPPPDINHLVPLSYQGEITYPDQAVTQAPTPDLLAINDEIREFVARYTQGQRSSRQRLHSLHRAVKSPGTLGIEYDPWAEGGAIEAYRRGSANCLSYASMFVAMARDAGLKAGYQWLEVRPRWSKLGERVAVSLHVNAVVEAGRGEQFMVDIDPLQPRDITGSRRITDQQAQALHHNNVAMAALADTRVREAWLNVVRGLQLAPDLTLLWVNLGAIYREADQYQAAEDSYLYALQLDPADRSAMTNLVILYQLQGREADSARWSGRVAHYRDSNPYFHAWLGEQAAGRDDWASALVHMETALRLSPEDSNLLYTAGVVHYKLGDLDTAQELIGKAIEFATLSRERKDYELQLEALQGQRLVEL